MDKNYERIFILERLTAIFLSKNLEPIRVQLDWYVEKDGHIVLQVVESHIMGAMKLNIQKSETDSLCDVWKNSKEYDLVAILKSTKDLLNIQAFGNPFKDASVFVTNANIVSMETDTDVSEQRVSKKKTMSIEFGERWEADSKDSEEFFTMIKQIRREIKLRDAGI